MFIILLMQLLGLKKERLVFYGRRLLKYNLFLLLINFSFGFLTQKNSIKHFFNYKQINTTFYSGRLLETSFFLPRTYTTSLTCWLVGHLLSLDSILFTAGVWELRRTYSTQKISLTLWLMCCKENAYCVLWSILYKHGIGIYCNIWICLTRQILYAKRQALKSLLQWITFISHKMLHTIIPHFAHNHDFKVYVQ